MTKTTIKALQEVHEVIAEMDPQELQDYVEARAQIDALMGRYGACGWAAATQLVLSEVVLHDRY